MTYLYEVNEFLIPYTFAREHADFYVTAQIYGDNKPLTVPVRTSYKAFKNNYR